MKVKNKKQQLTNSLNHKLFLSIDSELSALDLYKILKKNPYLVNLEDERNETFLSYAIKRNNNSIINLILTSPLLNLTYQNKKGNTYLHLAVIQQNIKLIKVLLDKGIFIDIQNNDGNTALHLAYYINNLEIIKLLINNNIDFAIKNKKGLTAEEIDPINNINEIAGYDVNMNFDNDEDENDNNNLCLNQNEDINIKSQKIDSSNSGETKYKSQISKKKLIIKNKENQINNYNDNKEKYKRISLKIDDNNNNNNLILNEFEEKNIINKKRNGKSEMKKKIRNISNIDNTEENIKIIDNNYPMNKEPIEPSQDFDISPLENNSYNFLDNNEINLSNNNIDNDNNSIQVNEFFDNCKGGNNSILSNIPIKSDDINKNNQKKKQKKVEKIIKCDNKPLYDFLMQINLQKYYDNLNNNGFEYINMIIDDTKLGNYLTDKQLKAIGINIPGDRAKILIRFEEKANMFEFNIPKSVYYMSFNLEQIEDDLNVCRLNGWLRNIRLEQYIRKFILNGYFSLDLLLVQTISKNPLTDEILKDDFGIEKLGHRARILNKLKEESKYYANKLRDSIINYQREENSKKICSECILC